eukprot:SAG31_NODE_3694_length_3982_cov_2.807108_3_plen_169_part_00
MTHFGKINFQAFVACESISTFALKVSNTTATLRKSDHSLTVCFDYCFQRSITIMIVVISGRHKSHRALCCGALALYTFSEHHIYDSDASLRKSSTFTRKDHSSSCLHDCLRTADLERRVAGHSSLDQPISRKLEHRVSTLRQTDDQTLRGTSDFSGHTPSKIRSRLGS